MSLNHISMVNLRTIAIPMIVYGASLGTYFISQAILGRALNNAELGIFAAQYGTAMILSSLMTWGLDIAALKFASIAYSRGDKTEFLRFIRVGVGAIAISAIPVVVAEIALFPMMSGNNSPPGFVLFAAIVAWSFSKFFASILRSVGWTSLSLIVDRVLRDGIIACFALVLMLTDFQGERLAVLNWALLLGVGTGLAIAIVIVSGAATRLTTQQSAMSTPTLTWLGTSLALWCLNLSELVSARSEVIVFSWLNRFADAGILSILATASGVAILPLLALNVVFQPRIASAAELQDRTSLNSHIAQFTWIGVAGTWLAGAIALAFPDELLKVFGLALPSAEHVLCLRVLVASRMLLAPIGPVASILMMAGGQYKFLFVYWFAASMSLLSTVIMTSLLLAAIQISGAILVYRQFGNVFGIAVRT
jgi:O-antigen/teichoic acid export membrane protein